MTQYAYAPYGSSSAAGPKVSPPVTGLLLLVAGLLGIAGSVTPWASLAGLDLTVSGMDGGDGVFTLVGSIAVLVTGLVIAVGQGRLWTSIVGLVGAAISSLTALLDISSITSRFRAESVLPAGTLSVGYGLWLVVGGGCLGVVASIVALSVRRIR